MGAPTEYYCDPAIAGDSGAGTIGDPFGDLQYALNNITRDSTNGDRINIKAGTDEVLGAALSLATYGTPSLGGPLIFQGYTSAAEDGGQGGIDCNAFTLFSSAPSAIRLIDLDIHSGASSMINLADFHLVLRCEIHNVDGHASQFSGDGLIAANNWYDINGRGIWSAGDSTIWGNYLKNGTSYKFNPAILISLGESAYCSKNIISVDSTSNGIDVKSVVKSVMNNSILSAGGTGEGISVTGDLNPGIIMSNLIEGFSGSGGVGINNAYDGIWIDKNAVYNCATNYSLTGDSLLAATDNETLSASPFAKSGSDTFANRFTYFAPADTGNVIGGAFVG